MPSDTNTPATPPMPNQLALRPRDAARALGIGERLLWSETKAGRIPHTRIGTAIIYPVDQLRSWLAERSGARP